MSDRVTSDEISPREWQIGNRTLIVSAEHGRALGVLNARSPLPLFPGSILQFDDGLGDQRVVGVGIIAGRHGGMVCVQVEPAGESGPCLRPARQAARPHQLRLLKGTPERWPCPARAAPIRPVSHP
jgi:hypothetical protein